MGPRLNRGAFVIAVAAIQIEINSLERERNLRPVVHALAVARALCRRVLVTGVIESRFERGADRRGRLIRGGLGRMDDPHHQHERHQCRGNSGAQRARMPRRLR